MDEHCSPKGSWFRIVAQNLKPKFLIVDIDETLGNAYFTIEDHILQYKNTEPKLIKSEKALFIWVPRPNAIEFLKSFVPGLKGWAIWTAGKDIYAKTIVEKWLHPNGLYPDFVLSSDHCEQDVKHVKLFLDSIKEGSTKWIETASDPDKIQIWKSEANVVNSWILDDNNDHFSEKTHGILVSSFDHTQEDTLYSQLMNFFDIN